MRRRRLSVCLVAGVLLPASALTAPPPSRVQAEVDFLLSRVATSGCEFYRNGSWHGGREGATHLRRKYASLVSRSPTVSTEQFIDLAATRSSMSGQPYRVRCGGVAESPSNAWLRAELDRFRNLPVKAAR